MNEEEIDLIKYAKKAKIKILYNKFLYEKLKYLSDYHEITKKAVNEIISKSNQKQKSILDNYNIKVKTDNNNLSKEYQKLNDKFDSMTNICLNDIPFGKPILLEEQNNNFCLEFIKMENNDTIKALNNSITQSKSYGLYRENMRDNLVNREKGDKEMEKYTTYIQNTMLFELKKCNEFNEKILKYRKKTKDLKNNMILLKNYISKNQNIKIINKSINEEPKNILKNNKIISIKKFALKSVRLPKRKNKKEKFEEEKHENNNKDDYDIKNSKINNKIIKHFQNIENLFDTSIQDIDIEQEVHSDDDGIFENHFINKKSLSNNHLINIHKTIPKLKLGLIEYNKKSNMEIDVYSLQRRKFKNKTLQNKIKEMKQKRDNMEITLNNLKKKVDDLKKLNDIQNENYKSIRSIYNPNNSISSIKPDLIVNSLNRGKNFEEEEQNSDNENKDIDSFLNGIEEVEEEEIIGVHDAEKSDEKKETKDTKKEEEEEKSTKKMNLKSTRKLLKRNIIFPDKSSIKPSKMPKKILKRSKTK